MTDWIKKFKTDKKFRRTIGIIILFIIFMNYKGQPQATQEFCNQFNQGGYGLDSCIDSGCVGLVVDSNVPGGECLADLLGWEFAYCTNTATSNFVAKSDSVANSICGVNKIAVKTGNFCLKNIYKCIDMSEDEQCDESWQKSLAKLMPFEFAGGWGCEGKAYAVLGFIAFAIMMVI